MSGSVFIDTNILVYSLSKDELSKRKIARRLLKEPHIISVQVLFEFINVAVKKLGYGKKEAVIFAEEFLKNSQLVEENEETVELAFSIFSRFKLQIFDSKIIASALLANCSILYSEDMQHGLVIDNKLRIVNPFI